MTDQPAQLPPDGLPLDGADLAAVDPELREPLPAIMAASPRPLTLDVLPARRALGPSCGRPTSCCRATAGSRWRAGRWGRPAF